MLKGERQLLLLLTRIWEDECVLFQCQAVPIPTWLCNVYLLRWMCCSAAFDQHSCSRSVRSSTLHLMYTCRHCEFICFSQLNSSASFFFTQHIFTKIASFFEECWVSKRGLMCVVFQCDGHRWHAILCAETFSLLHWAQFLAGTDNIEGVSSSQSGCLLCLYTIITYCRSSQNGEVSVKTVSDTNKKNQLGENIYSSLF